MLSINYNIFIPIVLIEIIYAQRYWHSFIFKKNSSLKKLINLHKGDE